MRAPAPRPCESCPYRRDVPSGVWVEEEYHKLPLYDAPTYMQPNGIFVCHQNDGRMCAGWVGCHDMDDNLAVRLAAIRGHMAPDTLDAVLNYQTDVPLFSSGQEAADHGMREIPNPGDGANRIITKITRRRGA